MATIMNDAAYMGFPLSIKRGNPAPVDTTAVWYNKTELETYAKTGATAYVGQILTFVNETNKSCEAYMISNEAGTLVKLASTTASGDLTSDVATLQGQVASLIEKVGAAKTDSTDAIGLYALIEAAQKQADKGVADAKTADDKAQSAQDDLDALEVVVGADDSTGLRKRIKANEDAIGVLNGSEATEGSVAKAVKDAIDNFATKATDDGTINTFKELVDWVAKHPEVAEGLASDITKLENILAGFGTSENPTVKAYVDSAISALKIGDYAKAADLTALAERVSALEKLPAHGITADDIAKWNAKQDAGDYVEQSAYDTKMEALEKADSDNATAIAGVKATAEAAVVANGAIVAGTATKITYDAKGLVTKGESLAVADIPTLGISKIDGLQDALDSKQGNLTFEGTYNAGTNKVATESTVNTAVDNLIHTLDTDGATDIDTKDSNTIHGAKLYADEVGKNTLASAKTYADGLVGSTSDLGKRVASLEGKVDVDSVSGAIDTAKQSAITTAGSNADVKIATAKTAILGEEGYEHTVKDAYDLANSKTTMSAVEAKGYAVKTDVDTTVADAKKAGTDAQIMVNGLSDKVGTVPTGKTVIQLIEEAQTAATYDDSSVKASIKVNTDAITKLNGADTVEGSVAKIVKEAVKAEQDRAEAKEQENATAIAGVKSRVDTFLADADLTTNAVDTLKELQDYITDHGTEAAGWTAKISANETAIKTEETRAKGEEAKLSTAISEESDRAKGIESGLTTRLDTLEGEATVTGSVKKTVKDAVDALNISQYAKDAEVVKKETGKSLIADTKITKLDGIAEGAQVNVIEKITVNGEEQTPTEKTVALESYKGDGTSIENNANYTLSIKEVSTDLFK